MVDMTDDELRAWISTGPSHAININSKTLNAICNAALKARAALQADHAAALARAESPEQALADKILTELARARTKFPGKNVTFAALVEETGELATAIFEETADRVEKEAVQVAVMAMRMVLDGDHCFDEWRKDKGLDALAPTARAALPTATGQK
jgi:DNA polymerase III alpha subunit